MRAPRLAGDSRPRAAKKMVRQVMPKICQIRKQTKKTNTNS
jgi:hypothetical protein